MHTSHAVTYDVKQDTLSTVRVVEPAVGANEPDVTIWSSLPTAVLIDGCVVAVVSVM